MSAATANPGVAWAREQAGLRNLARDVLVHICLLARPTCYASAAHIAEQLRTTERAIRVAISDLMRDGYILVARRNGKPPLITPRVGAPIEPVAAAKGAWTDSHKPRGLARARQLRLFDLPAISGTSRFGEAEPGEAESRLGNPESDSANPESDSANPESDSANPESDSADSLREEENNTLTHAHARGAVDSGCSVKQPPAVSPCLATPAPVPLAPAWHPGAAGITFARELGIDDPERVLAKFRDWAWDKAVVSADWNAAWRRWCGRESQFAGQRAAPRASATPGTDSGQASPERRDIAAAPPPAPWPVPSNPADPSAHWDCVRIAVWQYADEVQRQVLPVLELVERDGPDVVLSAPSGWLVRRAEQILHAALLAEWRRVDDRVARLHIRPRISR